MSMMELSTRHETIHIRMCWTGTTTLASFTSGPCSWQHSTCTKMIHFASDAVWNTSWQIETCMFSLQWHFSWHGHKCSTCITLSLRLAFVTHSITQCKPLWPWLCLTSRLAKFSLWDCVMQKMQWTTAQTVHSCQQHTLQQIGYLLILAQNNGSFVNCKRLPRTT